MSLPAARRRDLCTGHDCYPPRPSRESSDSVFYNSRGAHRQSDEWEEHCCITLGPDGEIVSGCHRATTVSGSSSVFVNSLAAARVQDQVDCGSFIMTGSHNVYIGS